LKTIDSKTAQENAEHIIDELENDDIKEIIKSRSAGITN